MNLLIESECIQMGTVQGVSHYIIFVMKYNYNYLRKNVMKYHYSLHLYFWKSSEYTTTPLLLWTLVYAIIN